ncbi:hypothetical protein BC826DRAFT_1018196 [Russula brevipes]|nr:hypothetical protein BC826DRAFT_1018196 [Russula brevipes]
MSALVHRLRNLLQRKSKGKYGHIQDFRGVPFYEARQPWWANSTMTELTWTKWMLPPEKPGDVPVRRPAWQRAGLCLAHLSSGVGFATLLLIARSRVVRVLHQLLIAGAHRHGTRGAVVPFARTRIEPGRDKTEVILRIEDVRGHWWIGLNRARLRGTPVPAAHMRDAILAEWGIRKTSQGDLGTGAGRWKSGPLLEN